MIATVTSWWDQCVGAAGGLSRTGPLWIVAPAGGIGTVADLQSVAKTG